MIPGVDGLITQATDHALANGRVEAFKKDIQEGKIKQASEDFEAYFLSYMLKVMRKTVPKGLFTENKMGEVFQSIYDEAIGKESAKIRGLGLAQYIETKLREDEMILSREGKVA